MFLSPALTAPQQVDINCDKMIIQLVKTINKFEG